MTEPMPGGEDLMQYRMSRRADGYALVIQHLDKDLSEKKLDKMISRWETLEDCGRSWGEDIGDFVDLSLIHI